VNDVTPKLPVADGESPLVYTKEGGIKARQTGLLPIEELHARHFPKVSAPARVSHIALSHGGADIAAELACINELTTTIGVPGPDASASSIYLNMEDYSFRWERHTEFSTLTVIAPPGPGTLFAETALELLPRSWVLTLRGEMWSALHLEIVAFPEPRPDIATLRQLFGGHYLIASLVVNEEAQFWTALRTHQDGFSRGVIYTNSTSERKVGRLLRTVLELETYANMALLGVPLAREVIPQVQAMEERLTELTDRVMAIKGLGDEQAALKDLSALSAQVERIMADTSSRFAATRAYSEIVFGRTKELDETAIGSLRTVSQFMEQRLRPAVKACESGQNRLMDLSTRVNRTSALLRTRVELGIQVQNQQLLKSMDERSKLSLYLQRSVEGLSVIVISYYIVGLIIYVLSASTHTAFPLDIELITAILVPVILVAVGLTLRRAKKRIDEAAKVIEAEKPD
jgi:uncharacterized membrane-anchored protein